MPNGVGSILGAMAVLAVISIISILVGTLFGVYWFINWVL